MGPRKYASDAERSRLRRKNATPQQREAEAERRRRRRENATPQQREAEAERSRLRRGNATPQQREAEAERCRRRRENATPQQREAEAERSRRRKGAAELRSCIENVTKHLTLQNHEELNEESCEEHSYGTLMLECSTCGAKHFPSDGKFSMCCHKGKVQLTPLPISEQIRQLIVGDDEMSTNFMANIHQYNSATAFESMGAQISPPPVPLHIKQEQVSEECSQASLPIQPVPLPNSSYEEFIVAECQDPYQMSPSPASDTNIDQEGATQTISVTNDPITLYALSLVDRLKGLETKKRFYVMDKIEELLHAAEQNSLESTV